MLDKEKSKYEIQLLVDKYHRIVDSGEIKDYSEEDTKNDFILPLFEALGWDTKNEYHKEVILEKKVSKGRVDFSFRLEDITKFFVEAKKFSENVNDRKYIDQAINYSYLKGVTWAVLTNFKTIKVFNAEVKFSHPAMMQYIELDCEDYVNKFDKLYQLSKESLEQNIIDTRAEEVFKKVPKKPLDERLFSDLMNARELFSKDILDSNENLHLNQDQIEEIVLRIISRLIFIRSLEDKKIEDSLLKPIIRGEGKKLFLQEINGLYRTLDETYDAKLFAPHLCDDVEILPSTYKTIIEGLYRSEEQLQDYDFSVIDADILGGIYEQYLGFVLKRTKEGLKLMDEKTHKKEEGVYYTPKFIVNFILKTIFEKLKKEKTDFTKICFLDPACGSGSFLLKTYDFLLNQIVGEEKSEKSSESEKEVEYETKVNILENNIYGVDQDHMAVELAQLNLFLKATEKKHKLPTLRNKIKSGDSLVDDEKVFPKKAFDWNKEFPDVMNDGKFDVIIGNPPYVSNWSLSKSDRKYVEYLDKKYSEIASGHWDLYIIFIKRALSLLKDGGYLSFIVPSSFSMEKYGTKLRELIVNDYTLVDLVDFGAEGVFEDVARQYNIFIIKNKPNEGELTNLIRFNKNTFQKTGEIDQKQFLKFHNCTFRTDLTKDDIDLIDKIKSDSTLLSKICCINVGVVAHSKTDSPKKFKKDDVIHDSFSEGYKKYVEGREISRYNIQWENKYMDYDNNSEYFHRPKFSELFERNKVIVRRVSGKNNRLFSTYDEDHFYTNDNLIHLILWDDDIIKLQNPGKEFEVSKPYGAVPITYVAGIISSKLISYFFDKGIATGTLQGTYTGVYPEDLREIPIRDTNQEQKEEISSLVEKIVTLNKQHNESSMKKTDDFVKIGDEIKETDNKIDELVYKIYGITDDEKKFIEKNFEN